MLHRTYYYATTGGPEPVPHAAACKCPDCELDRPPLAPPCGLVARCVLCGADAGTGDVCQACWVPCGCRTCLEGAA
jgi:hypothetical protein